MTNYFALNCERIEDPNLNETVPVSGVAFASVALLCIFALMLTPVERHLGALVLSAVQRLVRLVAAVVPLVAHQVVVDALAAGARELTVGARVVAGRAPDLVAVVATVVFAVTS